MYNDFRENLSKNINSEFKSENEDCFLIEASLNNELIKYFENNDNIQDKNVFGNIQNYIINDFSSTLNCLYKNKKIKLISKKLIEAIFNKEDLKDLIGIKYYCGNNKLIIEYKDNKALLLNDPLNESEINKNTYIIYTEDKDEKDKNSFFEHLISKKLDMSVYKSEIKDNIVSFEGYLNINKILFELLISISNYEKDIKDDIKNVFKDKDYFLINSEWINICKDCCSKIYDDYLNNIKNNKIETKDNNFDDIFNELIDKKMFFNLESKKLFEDIMNKEKIKPQKKEIEDKIYYENSYIINSKIKEIISKLINNEEKKINIFINDKVNIVNEKKIAIGNLNDKFIFIPKYLLFYSKNFSTEKKKLIKSPFEKYIESFQCNLEKEDGQILKEKNKNIGKLIVLTVPNPQKEVSFSENSKEDKKEIMEKTNINFDSKQNIKENNEENILELKKELINKDKEIETLKEEILKIKDMNKYKKEDNKEIPPKNKKSINKYQNKDLVPGRDYDTNESTYMSTMDETKDKQVNNINKVFKSFDNNIKSIKFDSDLNSKIKEDNDEKILDLNKQLEQSKKENSELKNIIKNSEQESEKHKKDIQSKDNEIKSQKVIINNKDNEIRSQIEKINNKENEISKLREEIKIKEDEIENQKGEILKKYNELNLKKEKENNNLKNILSKYEEENKKLKSFEENTKNTIDKLNKDIENLMKKNKDTEDYLMKKNKDTEEYFKNNIIQMKQDFFNELKRIYLNLCSQNSNKEAQEKILIDKLKDSKNYFIVLKNEIDNLVKELITKNKEAENQKVENQKTILSIIEKEKEVNKKISFLEDKENLIEKESKEIEIKKKEFEKEKEKNKIIIQKNNEMSKKNEELEKEIKIKTEKLNELEKKMEKLNELEKKMEKSKVVLPILPNKPVLIGLNNIGATCFMNSTLQCLSQTKELTKYFLNPNNENKIINNNIALTNKSALQLSPIYLELIKKLWDEKGEKSFSPYNFMNIVEKMNPLFKQGQAGDSKDFIIFILEQLHKEFKRSINSNNLDNNLVLNQYDRMNSFNYFFNDFKKECSIISDIFFGFTETTNECLYCKNVYNPQGCQNPICYNYGIFNCLIFPLEEVKNMKNNNNKNNNNQFDNNCVSIYDCFYYNQKSELFSGENKNYCNICKQLWDSVYTSKIYMSPNSLIIILNRGKGNVYNVKLDFSETIDISQFVLLKEKPQIIYNLYGVITHIGQSGPNAHFVASCKNPIDNKWYRFNDAFVNPIINFQKEIINFGTPYILFYTKN